MQVSFCVYAVTGLPKKIRGLNSGTLAPHLIKAGSDDNALARELFAYLAVGTAHSVWLSKSCGSCFLPETWSCKKVQHLNVTLIPGSQSGSQVRHLRGLRQLYLCRVSGHSRSSRDRRRHLRQLGRRLCQTRWGVFSFTNRQQILAHILTDEQAERHFLFCYGSDNQLTACRLQCNQKRK